MMQTFTSDDLVRHLYTEESPQEGEALEAFLTTSEKTSDQFDQFCSIKKALNTLNLEPSIKSINLILCYSELSSGVFKD
jgi:hypothetical protein